MTMSHWRAFRDPRRQKLPAFFLYRLLLLILRVVSARIEPKKKNRDERVKKNSAPKRKERVANIQLAIDFKSSVVAIVIDYGWTERVWL